MQVLTSNPNPNPIPIPNLNPTPKTQPQNPHLQPHNPPSPRALDADTVHAHIKPTLSRDMDSLPTELASTIQAGHVRQHPDPNLDLTPASSALPPATAATSDPEKIKPLWQQSSSLSPVHDLDSIDDDRDIPPSATSIPAPRRQNLPPLPDLRFEQSYLHSIANADTWWKVLLITARDQVSLPNSTPSLLFLSS